MTRPISLPLWQPAGRVEPSNFKKGQGFGDGEFPPAEFHNWLLERGYRNLAYTDPATGYGAITSKSLGINEDFLGSAVNAALFRAPSANTNATVTLIDDAPTTKFSSGVVKITAAGAGAWRHAQATGIVGQPPVDIFVTEATAWRMFLRLRVGDNGFSLAGSKAAIGLNPGVSGGFYFGQSEASGPWPNLSLIDSVDVVHDLGRNLHNNEYLDLEVRMLGSIGGFQVWINSVPVLTVTSSGYGPAAGGLGWDVQGTGLNESTLLIDCMKLWCDCDVDSGGGT